MKSKQIRVKESTYEEIMTMATLMGFAGATVVELAWREFKKTKKYAQLMLFANNDGE